jgi:hypothetical protein
MLGRVRLLTEIFHWLQGLALLPGLALALLGLWRDEGPQDKQPPLLSDIAGLLPWWSWLLISLTLALMVTFEWAYRQITPRLNVLAVARHDSRDGSYLGYACLEVTNQGKERVRGCRGRLFSVSLESDSHGPIVRDDMYPTYLQWSTLDGDGYEAAFDTQAFLDVAQLYGFVFTLVVFPSSQRDRYEMSAQSQFSYLLDIEITSENAGSVRHSYRLATTTPTHEIEFGVLS